MLVLTGIPVEKADIVTGMIDDTAKQPCTAVIMHAATAVGNAQLLFNTYSMHAWKQALWSPHQRSRE